MDCTKHTIHIVDDSKVVIKSLAIVLQKEGYKVSFTTNGKNAIDAIHKNKPTLIILDVEMPIMDGYETIKNLKKYSDTATIPIIFHTTLRKPEVIKHLFELGASDYISKPFVKEELLARVEKEIHNIILRNALKEKMTKLGEVISKDTLTRTSNRIHMTSIINRRMDKLEKAQQGVFSLIYIDIDNFHLFNGLHGLKVSDRALHKFANVVKRSLRDEDVLSRWEADRFMVFLPQISHVRLKSIAQNIINDVAKAVFSPTTGLTCSIAMMELSVADNINHVMQMLQTRMKEAKGVRKSCIVEVK